MGKFGSAGREKLYCSYNGVRLVVTLGSVWDRKNFNVVVMELHCWEKNCSVIVMELHCREKNGVLL